MTENAPPHEEHNAAIERMGLVAKQLENAEPERQDVIFDRNCMSLSRSLLMETDIMQGAFE